MCGLFIVYNANTAFISPSEQQLMSIFIDTFDLRCSLSSSDLKATFTEFSTTQLGIDTVLGRILPPCACHWLTNLRLTNQKQNIKPLENCFE